MSKEKLPHGGRGGKIDNLLFTTIDGVTLKEICEVAQFNKSIVFGHFQHLRRRHGTKVIRENGLYRANPPENFQSKTTEVETSNLIEIPEVLIEETPPPKSKSKRNREKAIT